jgi:hypothetical protein
MIASTTYAKYLSQKVWEILISGELTSMVSMTLYGDWKDTLIQLDFSKDMFRPIFSNERWLL